MNLLAQARLLPREFKVLVKKKFFSLINDYDFLHDTEFLDVLFKVFDNITGHFVSLAPTAFWTYPSPIYPIYLVKDGRLKDSDCPKLSYLYRYPVGGC